MAADSMPNHNSWSLQTDLATGKTTANYTSFKLSLRSCQLDPASSMTTSVVLRPFRLVLIASAHACSRLPVPPIWPTGSAADLARDIPVDRIFPMLSLRSALNPYVLTGLMTVRRLP